MSQNKLRKTQFFKSETSKKTARMLISAAVWLSLWQILYVTVQNEILISSPYAVFHRAFHLLFEKLFWVKTFHSFLSITEGYLLGVLCGVLLAILTNASKLLHAIFQPVLTLIKATPVVSFIILALVWMRKATVPVFISFLMVVPVVWANLSVAIQETNPQLLEMAKVYHFGIWKTIRHVYVPTVLPVFLTALTTATGFAWKSGIAAEVISTPQYAIGTELYNAKVYLETTDLFAWTLIVVLFSLLFEKLILHIVSKIANNTKKER